MRPKSEGAGGARGCRASVWGAAAAGLVAAVGLLLAVCWTDAVDLMLRKEMRLSPESRAEHEWIEPSLPLFMDIYLFNWTNPEGLKLGERPHLEQVGPYRYRETRRKENIVWHAHNHSVSYRTRRVFTFQAQHSNASLDDVITSVDALVASSVYRVRHWGFLWHKMVSSYGLSSRKLWVRRTARELLFDGYEDHLLTMAKMIPGLSDSGGPPLDRFGWFYKRNNSLDTDGHMTVSTGYGDSSLAGQIELWNYNETARHLAPACSKLSGSLGEFFPRRLEELAVRSVSLFSPDLCRPIPLTREPGRGAGTVRGVPVVRYSAGAALFDNGTLVADNACYCGGECLPSGALNVSACRFGSPAFISLPHFLHADPHYTAAVSGLRPDPRDHSFYLDIEPTTGVPLDVAARFQLNILITPNDDIQVVAGLPRLLMPVLWVQQRVQVDEDMARQIGAARAVAAWGAGGAGVVAALAGLVCALCVLVPRWRRARPPRTATPATPAPAELTLLVPPTDTRSPH